MKNCDIRREREEREGIRQLRLYSQQPNKFYLYIYIYPAANNCGGVFFYPQSTDYTDVGRITIHRLHRLGTDYTDYFRSSFSIMDYNPQI